jgi:REP element-mobilizing transposase RayT
MPSRFAKYTTHYTSRRTTGWDYAGHGVYFVTICTQDRVRLFGSVRKGRMRLNALGRIVAEEWRRSESIRDEVTIDAFVVMPDHMHGIVWMHPDGAGDSDPSPVPHGRAALGNDDDRPDADRPTLYRPARSLGAFIAGFKSTATVRVNRCRRMPGEPVWQRNYHDRIIRTERHLHAACRYIYQNPARWHEDRR